MDNKVPQLWNYALLTSDSGLKIYKVQTVEGRCTAIDKTEFHEQSFFTSPIYLYLNHTCTSIRDTRNY